jgi:hypothetical protein
MAALKTMLRFNVHLEAGIKIQNSGSGKVFSIASDSHLKNYSDY